MKTVSDQLTLLTTATYPIERQTRAARYDVCTNSFSVWVKLFASPNDVLWSTVERQYLSTFPIGKAQEPGDGWETSAAYLPSFALRTKRKAWDRKKKKKKGTLQTYSSAQSAIRRRQLPLPFFEARDVSLPSSFPLTIFSGTKVLERGKKKG